LELGVNNAFGGGGGFRSSGGLGNSTLDLHGYSETTAYLSSNNFTDSIKNFGSGLSTLTITNGITGSGAVAVYAGGIVDAGPGSGHQIAVVSYATQALSGSSNYSGGTTITGGKLYAYSATSLGTGPVTFGGGTLSLGPGYILQGGSTLVGNTLSMTYPTDYLITTAFAGAPQKITDAGGFTASFLYTANGSADGATFTIQNDPRGPYAISTFSGGTLGYGGTGAITPSAAIQFNIYSGSTGGIGTAFDTDGTVSTNMSVSPVSLSSGDPIQVSLTYANQVLTETLTDTYNHQTYTHAYTGVDIQNILGGQSGYVGFTAATGGQDASQAISNFQFNSQAPLVFSNALVVPAGVTGNVEVNALTYANTAQAGNLSVGSGGQLNVTPSTVLASNSPYSLILGGVTVNGAAGFVVNNNGTATGSLSLSAFNDGGVPAQIGFSGPGQTLLTAAATSLGSQTQLNLINSAIVKINAVNALGTQATVDVAAGSMLTFNTNATLNALTDNGAVVVNGSTLTISPTAQYSFGGAISDGTTAGSLIKTGPGVMVFTAANSYSGPTTISQGDLEIDGSLTKTGLLSVMAGGTLGGDGSVQSTVNLLGTAGEFAIVSPGMVGVATPSVGNGLPNIGDLSLDAINFMADSEYAVDISGSYADELSITGNLNLTGAGDDLFISGYPDGHTTYTIASYTGTLTGIFSQVSGLPSNYAVRYGTGTNSVIQLVPVPEPAGITLIAFGAMMLGRRRKRRVSCSQPGLSSVQ